MCIRDSAKNVQQYFKDTYNRDTRFIHNGIDTVSYTHLDVYKRQAIRLIRAAERNFCDFDYNTDGVLTMGTESYGEGTRKNVPIIYGDYYFAEALARLCGKDVMFW